MTLSQVAGVFGRGDKETDRNDGTETSDKIRKHIVVLFGQNEHELCRDN